MSQKPKLSRKEQEILIRHGVLEMPSVPPVNKLAEHIKARGGRWSLAVAATGGAVAQVTLLGQSFDAGADEENQALCTAFCSALMATQPAQASFLAPEPDDEDDGNEPADFDPFLDTELRPASPAATAGDFRDVVKDWLVTELGKAGGGELVTRDGEVIVVPPTAEATPEQMAEALRASGLPIEWDGELYRNVDTGDAYDGSDGEWVKRVYAPLAQSAAAQA